MVSRPEHSHVRRFAPTDTDNDAGDGVRRFLVRAVHRAYPAMTKGEVTDAAHVFLAAMQGLMMQEHAGLLGASSASISRRWRFGVDVLIAGFRQLSPPESAE